MAISNEILLDVTHPASRYHWTHTRDSIYSYAHTAPASVPNFSTIGQDMAELLMIQQVFRARFSSPNDPLVLRSEWSGPHYSKCGHEMDQLSGF